MQRLFAVVVGAVILFGLLPWPSQAPAEEGFAEQLGEQIDRGVERLGSELRQSWGEIRQSLDRLGVRGRVYSRLRWDKAIGVDSIDVEAREKDVVVLRGTVSDEATREKAIRLAQETVGVREVVDRLEVVPPRSERSTSPSD